jgi:hypothetical protein|tara:strand:+ start:273 stop:1484 length:1212 start_codon:yes stop_codon:yes gene_type:complete
MSWKDRLDNVEFSIQTGDGKIYYPLWRNAEKSKDFNVTSYDFINVEGSFVDRKRPKGNKYPLTFYFQGEDNIDQCDLFEESSSDSRIWTVEHPFYGTIKGQPTNLKRNDSSYNVTELTVEFWESIDDDYPLSKTSIKDLTQNKVDELNQNAIDQLVENAAPSTSDISSLKESMILIGSKQNPDFAKFNEYKNIVKKAVKSADNLVLRTETALTDAQTVINAPADFATSVQAKISSYIQSYISLKSSVNNLFDKYKFESQSASIIAGMCLSAVNPLEDDYIVRDEIEFVNDSINEIYADYLLSLDSYQVSIYDTNNAWSQNALIQSNVMSLVSFTSSGLFQLSFDARQERVYELTEDSNLILLTHKFLGLDADDKNMNAFRKINGIKNFEIYKIEKGRTIKYFV